VNVPHVPNDSDQEANEKEEVVPPTLEYEKAWLDIVFVVIVVESHPFITKLNVDVVE
jgi:hypothetical protein